MKKTTRNNDFSHEYLALYSSMCLSQRFEESSFRTCTCSNGATSAGLCNHPVTQVNSRPFLWFIGDTHTENDGVVPTCPACLPCLVHVRADVCTRCKFTNSQEHLYCSIVSGWLPLLLPRHGTPLRHRLGRLLQFHGMRLLVTSPRCPQLKQSCSLELTRVFCTKLYQVFEMLQTQN